MRDLLDTRVQDPAASAAGSPAVAAPRPLRRKPCRAAAGFTLVEIMIVVCIIGILVVVGSPYYSQGKMGAQRNACLHQQHQVFEAALLYCGDQAVPDGNLIVTVLQPDYIQPDAAECPSTQDASYDDYTIVILNGVPVDVICNSMGDEHPWSPF